MSSTKVGKKTNNKKNGKERIELNHTNIKISINKSTNKYYLLQKIATT